MLERRGPLKPHSPPPETHLLRQGHASYSFLNIPPAEDRVFKCLSLCGPFSLHYHL